MLTRKQHELLLYINDYLERFGVSPSFDEMKDGLGLKSKSGIHRLITGLEERGFIYRLPHRARALEVKRLPGYTVPEFDSNGSNSKIVRGNFGGGRGTDNGSAEEVTDATVTLPMLGRIAAGTPIEALRENDRFVDIPANMLGNGEYYALEVDGDSMIDAGIFDGDMVVIERCNDAEIGSIVVAIVENEEVTLKRLHKRHNSIALEPANPAFETRIFGPDQVAIQGRLRALIRNY